MKLERPNFSPSLIAVFEILALLFLFKCTVREASGTLFNKIPSSHSNIKFSNDISPTNSFNIYTYNNFYSGGGVALGDINNDGLLDVYLTANQKKNRLYLNQGNFKFKDITEKAGVGGTKPWSSGVSMADVNGDGLLDIYVCNGGLVSSKKRENELFINNGNLNFSERAEQFDLTGGGSFSIQASFFDYDMDGDLDMYLTNYFNSKPISRYNLLKNLRTKTSNKGGDRLYRNNLITDSTNDIPNAGSTPAKNNRNKPSFTNVTQQADIYSSEIGFGLGATVGDINQDGWMDIYVSNDFFERDYLYLNQRDGTFKEVIEQKMNNISTTSMSGDIADLNHDGYPEIFIADMLPQKEKRLKEIADFIGWEKYQKEVESGYHKKFRRNTLQLNNGNGTFSEIGRYAGVEATGWSWGGLIADFNLDGHRDVFVPNGIYKDVTGKDFLIKVTQTKAKSSFIKNGRMNYLKLTKATPSNPLSNYMFKNEGNLRFENKASAWGLAEAGFSNGAAYGDLDKDGDLDLIINNINMKAFVFRNRAVQQHPDRSWLQIQLVGQSPNTLGVGAQVELVAGGQRWYATQMPQRGFQSSVSPIMHVGLTKGISSIDSLKVRWPDGRVSLKTSIKARQQVVVKQAGAEKSIAGDPPSLAKQDHRKQSWLKDITAKRGLDWKHQESSYNDFTQSPMLYHMRSTEGPSLCSGDINGDGLEDFYVGGAAGQAGALFLQESNGRFQRSRQPALQADRRAEDTDCIFFDADGSGTPELLVASGSNEFPAGSRYYADRLYTYSGNGKLTRSSGALPEPPKGYKPTGVVRAADLDRDNDQDLFVGVRMNATAYGVPVGGYLLINKGEGIFKNKTAERAPALRPQTMKSAGITDAAWGDLNGDGTSDLIVAGEWMPLQIYFNRDGRLQRADTSATGLAHSSGWWQRIQLADLNGDGALDFIAGNHGLNSKFRASPARPVQMWTADFDNNGTIEQIFAYSTNGKGPYPMALLQNMVQQLPRLKQQYPTFASYSGETIQDIFSPEQLSAAIHYQAQQLASIIGWNTGDGHFRVSELPLSAQLAPMYAIRAEDLTGSGHPELLIGGNLSAVKPQAGSYNASYGTVLRQNSTGKYRGVKPAKSGFFNRGEMRGILPINSGGTRLIIVARNDKKLKVFKVTDENTGK